MLRTCTRNCQHSINFPLLCVRRLFKIEPRQLTGVCLMHACHPLGQGHEAIIVRALSNARSHKKNYLEGVVGVLIHTLNPDQLLGSKTFPKSLGPV